MCSVSLQQAVKEGKTIVASAIQILYKCERYRSVFPKQTRLVHILTSRSAVCKAPTLNAQPCLYHACYHACYLACYHAPTQCLASFQKPDPSHPSIHQILNPTSHDNPSNLPPGGERNGSRNNHRTVDSSRIGWWGVALPWLGRGTSSGRLASKLFLPLRP